MALSLHDLTISELRHFSPYLLALLLTVLFINYLLTPPAELRHLPCVPVIPLLWSFISGETENSRIKRLLLPFMQDEGEGAVLVYALGRWMVHILDPKIFKEVSDDLNQWPKEAPPTEMLFFRFIGKTNVVLSNGKTWQKHSKIIQSAFIRNLPIDGFSDLAEKLFKKMGEGGLIKWDDWTMRYTLDAIGTTILGYDFEAIEDDNSPFLKQYVGVMEAMASPLYLIFPRLETLLPRHKVIKEIDSLVGLFQGVLDYKRNNRGNDILTYMLEHPGMTQEEYRDNMVTFFVAGHDTTASAMSSLVYYLAQYPEYQERARKEVIKALGNDQPNTKNLNQIPFVQACIKEALRLNEPVTNTVPRISVSGWTVQGSNGKEYYIPPNTPVILSITSVHCNENYWTDAGTFYPDRFLGTSASDQARIDTLSWIPFSRGPRQCPARHFAMYELKTVAALMLKSWEWSLPIGSPHAKGIKNGLSPFGLSSPKNLFINFQKL
ncbi:cytochrome P450 [Crucibulum laeve]|uniref:Cytochrome P450 n=1 Tax=Crucibulum laeve TaxID=68775 RepID=A0A5C3M039_9AGAR|nr:cytochrome P450 [Crucibulum laeve]